ncbi:AAA family ATPase [Spirillospora sp. CA-253888]
MEQVEDDYDICSVDCPPKLDITTGNALLWAEGVVIPVDLDGLVAGLRDRFASPETSAPSRPPPRRKTRRRKPSMTADRHDGVPSQDDDEGKEQGEEPGEPSKSPILLDPDDAATFDEPADQLRRN